jgi:hypothetical protein
MCTKAVSVYKSGHHFRKRKPEAKLYKTGHFWDRPSDWIKHRRSNKYKKSFSFKVSFVSRKDRLYYCCSNAAVWPFRGKTLFGKHLDGKGHPSHPEAGFTTKNQQKKQLHFNDCWVADNGTQYIWSLEQ